MRFRPVLALSCLAVVVGVADVRGQAVAGETTVDPCPPAIETECPTKACAKPCHPCPKPGWNLFKCFHPAKCAPPKVTVIVPQPEVVVRQAPPRAVQGPAAAAPPAQATVPFLVPQMSYSMVPVVTMQAVPTVNYQVVHGTVPAQGVAALPAAVPGPAAVLPAAPAALPPCSDAEVARLMRALIAARDARAPKDCDGSPEGKDFSPKALAAMHEALDVELKREIARLEELIQKSAIRVSEKTKEEIEGVRKDTYNKAQVDQKFNDLVEKLKGNPTLKDLLNK